MPRILLRFIFTFLCVILIKILSVGAVVIPVIQMRILHLQRIHRLVEDSFSAQACSWWESQDQWASFPDCFDPKLCRQGYSLFLFHHCVLVP